MQIKKASCKIQLAFNFLQTAFLQTDSLVLQKEKLFSGEVFRERIAQLCLFRFTALHLLLSKDICFGVGDEDEEVLTRFADLYDLSKLRSFVPSSVIAWIPLAEMKTFWKNGERRCLPDGRKRFPSFTKERGCYKSYG